MKCGRMANLLSGEHIQDCGRPQREVGPHISTSRPAIFHLIHIFICIYYISDILQLKNILFDIPILLYLIEYSLFDSYISKNYLIWHSHTEFSKLHFLSWNGDKLFLVHCEKVKNCHEVGCINEIFKMKMMHQLFNGIRYSKLQRCINLFCLEIY